jgi:hypothetical protein
MIITELEVTIGDSGMKSWRRIIITSPKQRASREVSSSKTCCGENDEIAVNGDLAFAVQDLKAETSS